MLTLAVLAVAVVSASALPTPELSRPYDDFDYSDEFQPSAQPVGFGRIEPNSSVANYYDRLSRQAKARQYVRNLDPLTGATFGTNKRFDPLTAGTFGSDKRAGMDEIDRAGFRSFNKKNFDEIDRAGFTSFAKRPMDEIDRAGFNRFQKRPMDEIDRAGFTRFVKRPMDEIDRAGFDHFVKREAALEAAQQAAQAAPSHDGFPPVAQH